MTIRESLREAAMADDPWLALDGPAMWLVCWYGVDDLPFRGRPREQIATLCLFVAEAL